MKVITIDDDNDILLRVSQTVDYYDPETFKYIKTLLDFAEDNNYNYLSANQIGIQKRLIYFNSTIIINPVITKKVGLTYVWTTCLSCPDYISLVSRPYMVSIEYLNVCGKIITATFEGNDAANFMHLYDHLNGYLPIDVATSINKIPLDEQDDFLKTNKNIIINEIEEQKLYIKNLTKKS